MIDLTESLVIDGCPAQQAPSTTGRKRSRIESLLDEVIGSNADWGRGGELHEDDTAPAMILDKRNV